MRRLDPPIYVTVLLAALLIAGCGSDSSSPAGDIGIDALDLSSDTADLSDDARHDAGDTDDVELGPPPVAPFQEPQPFPIYDWRVAVVADPGAGDPVMAQIEAGAFDMPEIGVDENGVDWAWVTQWDEGRFGEADSGVIYAAAELYTAYPMGLIGRADTVHRVYLNGAPQPGDEYHTRRLRFPFRTREGMNLVVVRAFGGSHPPEIVFEVTPDELAFNLLDITVPDLVVGDDSVQLVGVPILNLLDRPALDATARVVANEHFAETTRSVPALGPGATTQVAFELRPVAPFSEADVTIPVLLRIESASMQWSYEREIELVTVGAEVTHRRTFLSAMDESAQYYGVVPPADFDAEREYGLVLSLHGAGVHAINQARSYSPKDWTYIVAPTNRRPFGFDWEAWGRLDGIEVLDDASAVFRVDPERVYVTGHSMGGHGTWQLGALFPGRFAVVAPSAGWGSFYSYVGYPRPTGPFARSEASSDTHRYLSNLARRGIYVIHGTADSNVPIREGREMVAAVSEHADDVVFHEEQGAGHWWDGDASPGVDCVDWPPLFAFMQAHRFDPFELDFELTTPAPSVNAYHSYVTIHSAADPYEDSVITSVVQDGAVTLTTSNVRSLSLAGDALVDAGVTSLSVDGDPIELVDGTIELGPSDGKREDVYGPFNQVFHRPFCFVYPDDGPDAYRQYAAFLLSKWSFRGNGHGCALPHSALTEAIRRERNIIYLGLPRADVSAGDGLAFDWSADAVALDGRRYEAAAVVFVFPDGDRLGAVGVATEGDEYLLFRLQPFDSHFALPDYLIWSEGGARAAGFFDAEWAFDPDLGVTESL